MCVCIYVYIYVCVYICVCIYRYTYTFIIEDGAMTEARVKNNEPTHQWNLYFPFFN